MTAAPEPVLYERRGMVAWLTLNRPERANAYNTEMVLTLQKHALAATNDPEVRVVVVTGAGRHFCGGADIRARDEHRARLGFYHTPADPGTALDWVPKPVIAAINGAAMGGGCEIALSCDFRFMAQTARIGLPEIKMGGLPGGGGLARAARLIGLSSARRLIMLGEPIDAAEAERIGLVDQVNPDEMLLKEVERFADQLAARAPQAIRAAKRIFGKTLELDLKSALDFEREIVLNMTTPEEQARYLAEAAAADATYGSILSKTKQS